MSPLTYPSPSVLPLVEIPSISRPYWSAILDRHSPGWTVCDWGISDLLPGALVQVGERHLAGARVEALDPRKPLVVQRPAVDGAVGQRDAVGNPAHRLVGLVHHFDLDPAGPGLLLLVAGGG